MVENYIDRENKEIKKGFYKDQGSNHILYFTGIYKELEKTPIFEMETNIGKTDSFPSYLVHRLSRMTQKEVREKLREIKQKANFLERRLKE